MVFGTKPQKGVGGGPNSFRGGKKTFSVKAKLGNWVEASCDPDVQSSGFTSPGYMTMAQLQMLEGLNKRPTFFGTALPAPEAPRVDMRNIFHPDKTAAPREWESVSTSFHKGAGSGKVKGFSSVAQLPKGMQGEALENYRSRWTQESEVNRGSHFATTNNSMLNSGVAPKYRLRETRKLPGLPLCIEKLVSKIHEKDPERGIQVFTSFLKGRDASFTVPAFSAVLQEFGVALSLYDTERLIEFLDSNHTGVIHVNAVLDILRGPLPQHRETKVREAFNTLLSSVGATCDITLEQMASLYCPTSDLDVVEEKVTAAASTERFLSTWESYASEDRVSEKDFMLYYHDLNLAFPSNGHFERMLGSTWSLV